MDDTVRIEPLQEMTTIAAGNAATALSKLIGEQVLVALPSVKIVSVEKITGTVGQKANISTVALVKIQGDVTGLMIFTIDPGDAQEVTEHIIKQQTSSPFKDEDQAVIREMVNIIAGAATSAWSKLLDLHLMQSVPASTTDMLGAILDPFIAEFGTAFHDVCLLQETFTISPDGKSLGFLAIIDPPSTDKVLRQLDQKVQGVHANY